MKMLSSSGLSGGITLLGVCGMVALLAGCGSPSAQEAAFSSAPASVGSASVPVATGADASAGGIAGALGTPTLDRFRVGDLVTVAFSGVEPPPAPHEERIKEDGSITLPMIGSVIASGKSTGELQKELQDRYVPRFYVRLVVTVKSLDRVYYVGGEVRTPSAKAWFGEVTVTQAIQSSGDFTDFANKKKVQLIRVDGTTIIIDCKKALKDPKLDPKVLPGDKIHVPRRLW